MNGGRNLEDVAGGLRPRGADRSRSRGGRPRRRATVSRARTCRRGSVSPAHGVSSIRERALAAGVRLAQPAPTSTCSAAAFRSGPGARPARSGSVRLGPAWPGSARLDPARSGVTRAVSAVERPGAATPSRQCASGFATRRAASARQGHGRASMLRVCWSLRACSVRSGARRGSSRARAEPHMRDRRVCACAAMHVRLTRPYPRPQSTLVGASANALPFRPALVADTSTLASSAHADGNRGDRGNRGNREADAAGCPACPPPHAWGAGVAGPTKRTSSYAGPGQRRLQAASPNSTLAFASSFDKRRPRTRHQTDGETARKRRWRNVSSSSARVSRASASTSQKPPRSSRRIQRIRWTIAPSRLARLISTQPRDTKTRQKPRKTLRISSSSRRAGKL